MELANKYKSLLAKHGIDTPLRLAHFFAQVEHESGLKPVQENLMYSAERLVKVFKKYFNDVDAAKPYAKNPEKIANRVYANRMGNGDEDSGDGFKYRGRGFIQLTGKSNYKALSTSTKVDYINHPDKLLNEADAMVSALWFWSKKKLNTYADADNIISITKIINGGTNGLEHRKALLVKYKKLWLDT